MTTTRLRGEPVAARLRESVEERVAALREEGVAPTLGTVLMSDDPADGRFMDLKHDACEAAGVETRDHRLDPAAPAERLYRVVEDLSADPAVHAVFVQVPLPEHVAPTALRERIAPRKDVDCFHPENVGRLVGGDPRFVPATPAAVLELLDFYDVRTGGREAVVVGRSDAIGKPLATLLAGDRDATVTVCHSRTDDLGEKTRRGDLVVTAAGQPELVDGSMLSPGAVVVDVSANRRSGEGPDVVGDVAADAADAVAAMTPVPGGVGPVTLATLLGNVVRAAEDQTGESARVDE